MTSVPAVLSALSPSRCRPIITPATASCQCSQNYTFNRAILQSAGKTWPTHIHLLHDSVDLRVSRSREDPSRSSSRYHHAQRPGPFAGRCNTHQSHFADVERHLRDLWAANHTAKGPVTDEEMLHFNCNSRHVNCSVHLSFSHQSMHDELLLICNNLQTNTRTFSSY